MSIQSQIQRVVAECGSAYRISQMIAAETDPTNRQRMACEKRWQKWPQGQGLKTLTLLEQDLAHLGYVLKIEPR